MAQPGRFRRFFGRIFRGRRKPQPPTPSPASILSPPRELYPYEPPPPPEPYPYEPPAPAPPPWYPPEDQPESAWYDRWEAEGEPSWYQDDVTIWNNFGEPITMTAEDWYELTPQDKETILASYGMIHLDIIHQLEEYGYWTDEDWAYWRELYAQSH
jgi:hypothetical protein